MFSTLSCFFSYPFSYELSGLEFYPAWKRGSDAKNTLLARDQGIAADFEHALHRISSCRVEGERLIISLGGQASLVTLSRIHPTGVEARRWRISKYRSQRSADVGPTVAKEFAEITFLQGRIECSPGCGGWVGSYSLSNNTLAVEAGYGLAGSMLVGYVCAR